MRDTLSTNGEHLRVAEVKSFPAISKSMRSVNGDQNGANLKKWSVLLVRTIALVAQLTNFSFESFMRFSQNMPLYFSYTIVQKRQEWLKTQNQGRGGGGGFLP